MNVLFKSLTTMVCLVTLLLGLGSPSGMVVCYGANGHVAIESPNEGCPLQAKLSANHGITDAQQEMVVKPQNSTCTDIPLTLQSASLEESYSLTALSRELIQLPSVVVIPPLGKVTAVTDQQLPQPPPANTVFLKIHRTVVLRI